MHAYDQQLRNEIRPRGRPIEVSALRHMSKFTWQVTSFEMQENGQNQSLYHKEIYYSAEDVRLLLDTSLTDSTVSETGSEDKQSSNIDSNTEYDLSDPEARLSTEDNELERSGAETFSSTNPLYRCDADNQGGETAIADRIQMWNLCFECSAH